MNEHARWAMARDVGVALIGLLALIGVAGLFSGQSGVGDPAPEFGMVAVEGGYIQPSSHDLMVLQFWIVGCGPCKRQIKQFSQYAAAHPETPLYAVNANGLQMDQLRMQARRTGATYPVLQGNPRLAKEFGVAAYPTTVVVKDGVVVARQRGGFSAGALERMVASVR